MFKQKASALSLLLLFTLFLIHGFVPADSLKAFDTKAKAVILLDQAPEDAAAPDLLDKKFFTIISVLAISLFLQLCSGTYSLSKNYKAISHFLIAVFYQSNYVIMPLRF